MLWQKIIEETFGTIRFCPICTKQLKNLQSLFGVLLRYFCFSRRKSSLSNGENVEIY